MLPGTTGWNILRSRFWMAARASIKRRAQAPYLPFALSLALHRRKHSRRGFRRRPHSLYPPSLFCTPQKPSQPDLLLLRKSFAMFGYATALILAAAAPSALATVYVSPPIRFTSLFAFANQWIATISFAPVSFLGTNFVFSLSAIDLVVGHRTRRLHLLGCWLQRHPHLGGRRCHPHPRFLWSRFHWRLRRKCQRAGSTFFPRFQQTSSTLTHLYYRLCFRPSRPALMLATRPPSPSLLMQRSVRTAMNSTFLSLVASNFLLIRLVQLHSLPVNQPQGQH